MLYSIGMTIGKRIRLAREARGLTLDQIAEAIGTTKQNVSQYEKKGTGPERDKIPALRKILQVTFAWLLTGDGPPPDKDSPEVRMDDWMVTAFQKKPGKSA